MKKPTIDRNNPALNFISGVTPNDSPVAIINTEGESKPEQLKPEIPEGYRLNPKYIEKKTRRVQLVFKPSLYDAVRERAEQNSISVNDYIQTILENYIKEH